MFTKKFLPVFDGILIVAFLTLVLMACGGHSSTGSLNGTWKSDSPSMTAHISNDTIEIDFALQDGDHAMYWKGSAPASASDGSTFVSKGDTQTMGNEALTSSSSTKRFVYKNGKLSFPFSILGTTRTVELKQ
jgi:hypothetical protein